MEIKDGIIKAGRLCFLRKAQGIVKSGIVNGQRKESQGKNTVPHLSSCVAKCGKPYQRRQECIPTFVSRCLYMWGS